MPDKKRRVKLPNNTADSVLFTSDRTCCKCRIPGRAIQIHHIDDDPSNSKPENLAVLCLECHNETLLHGGFGRSLTSDQIIMYRDDWYRRVNSRRTEADRLAALAMATTRIQRSINVPTERPILPEQTGLMELVSSLPELRRLAFKAAQPRLDNGVTLDMVEAHWDIIRVLEASWAMLANYYPAGHFFQGNPRDYFSAIIGERARWHYLCNSSSGVGYSGTIVQILTAGAVLDDVEAMIAETVLSLTGGNLAPPEDIEINVDEWLKSWHEKPYK